MTKIFLYGAEATYVGHSGFEWRAPTPGHRHKVILFLAQDDETSQEDRAMSELTRFGFVDLHIGVGRPIQVESLNDPRMSAFRSHYEGALVEGCSLVWYP